jgi:hypothetical protein
MIVSFSETTPVHVSREMRLGLLARVRAVVEARRVSERSRRRLAASIDHCIDRAQRPWRGFSAAIPVSEEAAHDARDALVALARRLREPGYIDPDGMRSVRTLLVDGAGPMYAPQWPGQLRRAANRAREALDGRGAGS